MVGWGGELFNIHQNLQKNTKKKKQACLYNYVNVHSMQGQQHKSIYSSGEASKRMPYLENLFVKGTWITIGDNRSLDFKKEECNNYQ